MAQTVHLTLTANKTPIEGESTQLSLDRAGTIECVYFESAVTTPRDAASGRATGKRQYAPLRIRKRIDMSSPLLARALTRNEACEATFKFYRPAAGGHHKSPVHTGEEHFYTVKLEGAFVSDIRLVMPDTLENPGIETREAYEEVTFTFDRITWTHQVQGKEHDDSWSQS